MSSKPLNGRAMSVEFLNKNPNDSLVYAFKLSGKRVVVQVSQELYDDFFLNKPVSDLDSHVQNSLEEHQTTILGEYAEKKTADRDPQYTLTTQGLI